jgi:hypothetical protein
MDLVTVILFIVVVMFGVVIYQSRTEPFDLQMYIKRFTHLIVIFLTYFKDIGLTAATNFRSIDWDLTAIM